MKLLTYIALLCCAAFSTTAVAQTTNPQVVCLARNIYHEAGNQSRTGQIAVANVVMNRVADRRFPDTPCDVVNHRVGGRWQFDWARTGFVIRHPQIYRRALAIADDVYHGRVGDVTNGALYFHAANVRRSSWWNTLRITTRIGNHIFFRN